MTLINSTYEKRRYDASFANLCTLAKAHRCFVLKNGATYFIKSWRKSKDIMCHSEAEVRAHFNAMDNSEYHSNTYSYENKPAVQTLNIPRPKRERFMRMKPVRKVEFEQRADAERSAEVKVLVPQAKAQAKKPLELIEEFLSSLKLRSDVVVKRADEVLATTISLTRGFGKYASVRIPTNNKPAEFKLSKAGKPISDFLSWRKMVVATMAF